MADMVSGADGTKRRQPSLEHRMFVTLAVVATVLAAAVLALSTVIYQLHVIDDTGDMLEGDCRIISSILSDGNQDYGRLSSLDLSGARLTLIDEDGKVLYDNENNYEIMSSHADRPEIEEAERDGIGSSERESSTAGNVSIYRALRMDDGRIIRMSVDRESTFSALFHDTVLVFLVAFLLVLISWFVSRGVAKRLMRPVLDIDPAKPDPTSSYVELKPIISQIAEQQATLAEQVEELRGADLMRREFTANVTHELKTPLASISGASELIRDGIARPEDVPEFAGRIFDEAHHMTELVNDILILSKLDESERSQDRALVGHEEPVDLHHVLADTLHRLGQAADERDVKLKCKGDSVLVRGVPRLLGELAHNLCENAIRYNREGGKVVAESFVDKEGRPVLRVSDTGIGIPPESQKKVFERFYRVDSSRARETGGTGLGLAIVKHAAAYHGADLSLESTPGKGTTITVTFPASSLVPDGELV